MKIAITGSTKLAGAIAKAFNADCIRINSKIDKSQYDIFINNAHLEFQQCNILLDWFQTWQNDSSKLIINISSRSGLPNLSVGYIYAAQKAALNHLSDNLIYNSPKKCRITTLCLGLIEHDLPSLKYNEIIDLLRYIINLPTHIELPKVYLQHSANYKEIQKEKEHRMADSKEKSSKL